MQHVTTFIYLRISMDRNGSQVGVERQRQDCEAKAQRNGWTVARTFVDNDVSAYSGKPRPEYLKMLEALERGEAQAVVAWHDDRLHRSPVELEHYMAICEPRSIETDFAQASALDLRTSSGRMMARIRGAIAREEVEHKSERERMMRLDLARKGRRHVTLLPYGWLKSGELHKSQAAVVREITHRLIANETATSVARDLNARNIPTAKGAQWTGIGVRKTALRALNAGLRDHKGTIYEGDGSWKPIVTRDEWEQVSRVLSLPAKAYRRTTGRKYPFTGLVRCGVCDSVLSVGMGRVNSHDAGYRCDQRKSNESTVTACGGVQRAQIPVDWFIKEMIIRRMDNEALRSAVNGAITDQVDAVALMHQVAAQKARIESLVDDYASGDLDMTVAQFNRAKSTANERLRKLEQQIHGTPSVAVLSKLDFSKSVREIIESADLYTMREIAEVLIECVRIKPQPKSGWTLQHVEIDERRWRFLPELVEVVWRV